MTDVRARISPGIKALETLDRMDIFRRVVERADFESGDKRLCELEVGDLRVGYKVVGSTLAIGFPGEFSARRKSEDG